MESDTTEIDLEQLARDGRYRELIDALEARHDEQVPEARLRHARLWGELAARGQAPLSDLLAALELHAQAEQPTVALRALAIEALERAGLGALSAELRDGDPRASDDDPHRAREAALREAARCRARGDRAGAAAASARACTWLPDADDAAAVRVIAALDAWAVGAAGALDLLRAVRDDGDAPAGPRMTAREVLDAIEAEPGRAPRWIDAAPPPDGALDEAAGAVLGMLARVLGVGLPDAPDTTCSHVRAALTSAGVVTVRLVLDAAKLAILLGRPRVRVLLEEEQATRSAFLLVLALEQTGGLLVHADPAHPGAGLRPLAAQWRRSAQAGCGALVICGLGAAGVAERDALAALGCVDDPRLALIDRAHFDPEDPDVPHAHVAQLARQAIAVAPEIPMPHRRLGEALIGLGRLGRLDDEELLVERFVAETRERFPDAEWPLQIYAQALELWRRWPEAMVAWGDAALIDDDDPRNHLGQVRAVRQLDGLRGARWGLRRAATLDPRDAQTWVWLAEEELARDAQAATAAARLATAIDPTRTDVLVLEATLAERRGDLDGQLAKLAAACEGERPELGQTMSLWRRHLWAGRFDELDELTARRILGPYGGSARAWALQLEVLLARGEGEQARAALDEALQRAPLQDELLDAAVRVLNTVVPPDELADAYAELEVRLAGQPEPLVRIARGLAHEAGRDDVALPALERLTEGYPQDANALYAIAQVVLARGTPDAGAAALLERSLRRAIELAPRFPWIRYVLGWRLLASAPDEVASLIDPIAGAAPVLCWDLVARAFDATGRAADAAELRERLPEIAASVVEHGGFLRRNRLLAPLRDLLAIARAHDDAPHLRAEEALLYARDGDHAAAVAVLRELPGITDSHVFGRRLVIEAGLAAQGEVVREAAPAVLATLRRDARVPGDPWDTEAAYAAAMAAAGDQAPRARLLEIAGRHVGALRRLALTSRALASPTAADDLSRLRAVAPGSAATLDHPEL